MSVHEISKIQLRRGKKTQQGMPQLSSAELAWAIDTQELYIGNGSVAEGAPAHGNTKILTEHDDITNIPGVYQYKNGLIKSAIKQSFQERLDDSVTNLTFNIGTAQQFQSAIDELYDNILTKLLPESYVTLRFLPGRYTFDTAITIPSFITLTGAGIDKTIFEFTSTKSFIFNSVATHCEMYDFTIEGNTESFEMNAASDSLFQNLKLKCIAVDNTNSTGIKFTTASPNGDSTIVACSNNKLHNIIIDGFESGITGDADNTAISLCHFSNGIDGIILNGKDNTTFGNRFTNIQNQKINFISDGNQSLNDYSDDELILSSKDSNAEFLPLVIGAAYTNNVNHSITVQPNAEFLPFFRIPNSLNFTINYKLTLGSATRIGKLSYSCDEYDCYNDFGDQLSDVQLLIEQVNDAILVSYNTGSTSTLSISYTYSIA